MDLEIFNKINDQMCSESWKVIPTYYFDKYGGLKFLLHCNYDKRFLKQANFPKFYKQILLYFSELKSSSIRNWSYSTIKKFKLTVKQSFIRAGSVGILFLFKIFWRRMEKFSLMLSLFENMNWDVIF